MASLRRAAAPLLTRNVCHQCLRTGATRRISTTPTVPPKHRTTPQTTLQPISYSGKRWHSTPANPSKQYDYAQIKQMSQQPSSDRILIDVREPAEVSAGSIPSSINIPIKTSPDALFLPAEEFEDRFGFEKPSHEKEVVFYCKSGVRSRAAAELARQVGYEKVGEYSGSWLDWEKNEGSKG